MARHSAVIPPLTPARRPGPEPCPKSDFLSVGVSIDEAKEGERIIILNRLAVIRDAIGSLDKEKQIVALNGFVNSEPEYYGHPQVINGAAALPLNVVVGVDD